MPKKFGYVIFALLASVFCVLFNVFDNIILHGPLTDFYAYSIVGGLVGIIVTFTLGLIIGKKIEPAFTGFKILPRKAMLFAFGSGLFGCFMTAVYLLCSSMYDPSIITPLSQTSLIYLLLIDSLLIERALPSLTEIESIIIIVIGSFLVSFHAGQINLQAILLLLIFNNLFFVLYVILRQQGIRVAGVDVINFRFWMFLFLSIFLIALSSVISVMNKNFDLVMGMIINNFVPYIPWAILSMVFVFLFFVFDLKALKIGKASIVQSLESFSIILAIPVTLIVSLFLPNIFGGIEYNLYTWFVKISGAILIFLGIVIISLTENVKYYLIIKPELGKEKWVMEKLKQIREVEYVTITTNSDILVRVNVKGVGRMNDTITTKIKNIDHIKTITSMPILKEG
jgi:uncharacterized membrane protein/DNA-binding Lrp family transcriptional regulator